MGFFAIGDRQTFEGVDLIPVVELADAPAVGNRPWWYRDSPKREARPNHCESDATRMIGYLFGNLVHDVTGPHPGYIDTDWYELTAEHGKRIESGPPPGVSADDFYWRWFSFWIPWALRNCGRPFFYYQT